MLAILSKYQSNVGYKPCKHIHDSYDLLLHLVTFELAQIIQDCCELVA